MRFFILIPAMLLLSCGKGGAISLTLKMPAGLSRGSARYERFLKRAIRLSLVLESNGGVRESLIFAPQEWERLPLPEIRFPKQTDDVLRIRAEVWDRNLEGNPRSYPVAVGDAKLEAEKMKDGGIVAVTVSLAFKVGLREFDY